MIAQAIFIVLRLLFNRLERSLIYPDMLHVKRSSSRVPQCEKRQFPRFMVPAKTVCAIKGIFINAGITDPIKFVTEGILQPVVFILYGCCI